MGTYLIDTVIPYVGRALSIVSTIGGMSITQLLGSLTAQGTIVCQNLITGEWFTALVTPQAIAELIPVLGNVLSVTSTAIIQAIQNVINSIIGSTMIGDMPVWVFMMTTGCTGAMIVRIVFHLFF